MTTGFLKKHRAAMIIAGSYILLMLVLYLLIPKPTPVRRFAHSQAYSGPERNHDNG